MKSQKKVGLIGRTLKHSYSKIIHEKLGEYSYHLIELEPEQVEEFILNGGYDCFNVTIPYKTDVIKYLDYIHPLAKKIGAVNTVVRREGKLYGYNTDFLGMIALVEKSGIDFKDKNVLIVTHSAVSRVIHYLLGTIPEDANLSRINIPNLRIIEYKI